MEMKNRLERVSRKGSTSASVSVAYSDSDRANPARNAPIASDHPIAAATMGIDNALYNAFGQRSVATIYGELNQYAVIMEWAPEYTRGPPALQDIYVASNPTGATGTAANPGQRGASTGHVLSTTPSTMVPLSALARVVERAVGRPASGAVTSAFGDVQDNRVVRFTAQGDVAAGPEAPILILPALPGPNHNGGQLASARAPLLA